MNEQEIRFGIFMLCKEVLDESCEANAEFKQMVEQSIPYFLYNNPQIINNYNPTAELAGEFVRDEFDNIFNKCKGTSRDEAKVIISELFFEWALDLL